MDPATEGPDDPDVGSVHRYSMSEATVDIFRSPNPQSTLSLIVPDAAIGFISLLVDAYTTHLRNRIWRPDARSTLSSYPRNRILFLLMDVVGKRAWLIDFDIVVRGWKQFQTTDEQSTSPESHTQSNLGNLMGALFPPIIALPQKEALRARTMTRNRFRRSRNVRFLNTPNTMNRDTRAE